MDLNLRDNAIRLLAEGFGEEFADYVAGDDRVHDLLMELASKFVEENVPIVDDDSAWDLAYELFIGVTVTKVK